MQSTRRSTFTKRTCNITKCTHIHTPHFMVFVKFVTVCTTSNFCSLSTARLIQPIIVTIFLIKVITLILSSHLLPSVLSVSCIHFFFPHTYRTLRQFQPYSLHHPYNNQSRVQTTPPCSSPHVTVSSTTTQQRAVHNSEHISVNFAQFRSCSPLQQPHVSSRHSQPQ